MAEKNGKASLEAFDDASLIVTIVETYVRPLYLKKGLYALNEAQKTILVIFGLDNEVCNGGFGQWLFHQSNEMISVAASCLERIGANDVARLVNQILGLFGEQGPSFDDEILLEQLEDLGDVANKLIVECDREFEKLEKDLFMRLAGFARSHLQEICQFQA